MKVLTTVLNEEIELYLQTWNYHWNIEGPLFPMVHKLLEEQYITLRETIDELAERIRALGGLSVTEVKASFDKQVPAIDMLKRLAKGHEGLSKKIRTTAIPAFEKDDPGTTDLLTSTVEMHDKMAWMLRSTAK